MKTKRLILKILAACTAFVLIAGILTITNSFVGNPVSAYIAQKKINSYIDRNYSFLDLKVERPRYNFKFGEYMSRVKDSKNIDIHFSVYYRKGEIRDSYASDVIGKFNVIQRLENEYTAYLRSLLSKEEEFYGNTSMVMYEKGLYEGKSEVIKLGMDFDKSLPLEASALIRIEKGDASLEDAAGLLTKAHRIFKENGCKFIYYDLYCEGKDDYIMVNRVTAEHIESGRLQEMIQQAVEEPEGKYGITVNVKNNAK